MNMIERVARALCAADGYNPDDLETGNRVGDWEGTDVTKPNGDVAHWLWREWAAKARAAIEAMREPPEAYTSLFPPPSVADERGNYLGWYPPMDVRIALYRSMIDAALREASHDQPR